MRYFGSLKQASYMLSGEVKYKVGMIFGFGLCIGLLSVIQITYFRKGLEKTWKVGVLGDDEVYHC